MMTRDDVLFAIAQIRTRLLQIEKDDRLSLPPATVHKNAPLALIQFQLETERRSLLWVLTLFADEVVEL